MNVRRQVSGTISPDGWEPKAAKRVQTLLRLLQKKVKRDAADGSFDVLVVAGFSSPPTDAASVCAGTETGAGAGAGAGASAGIDAASDAPSSTATRDDAGGVAGQVRCAAVLNADNTITTCTPQQLLQRVLEEASGVLTGLFNAPMDSRWRDAAGMLLTGREGVTSLGCG